LDKDETKNIHVALGEAVMSILESQSALSNHTILERLQQLADSEADEEKIAAYWQAKKAFRHIPQSVTRLRRQDVNSTDSKTVRMPPNRFPFRRTRVDEGSD
jgi:outer membrane receptor for Fe3+-dicitrate